MKVIYRVLYPIGQYERIERTYSFYATDYFIPEGTTMYYFRLNEFSYKTVPKEDIISIEQ